MKSVVRISVALLVSAIALWVLLATGVEAAQVVRESFSIPDLPVSCL